MLALITGSGFYELEALAEARAESVPTPFGEATVTRGRWNGRHEVLFLARHGVDHSVPPAAINYRANLWALRECGATRVVATAVSGGIAEHLSPGTFVLIDDFIDFTTGRQTTFYDKPGEFVHAEMSAPYDPDLGSEIVSAAAIAAVPLSVGGTYCATDGPRFETRAEIRMMQRLGGDLVGMTGYPEVSLANELELRYSSIGIISNRATGLSPETVSVPEIMEVLASASGSIESLFDALVDQVG